MFAFKKMLILGATLAALAIPSLASADDYDRRDVRRDDYAVAQLRSEIARDRIEIQRDERMHRWAEARQERRELERHEMQLRELLRDRGHFDRR
jgi:hypothetical protein